MTFDPSGTNPTEMHAGDDVADDVEERHRFEALLSDLAAGFINLEPEKVDQAIEDCLRRIVEALGLDRSTLYQRSGDDLVGTHSWAAPGFAPSPLKLGRADLPWAVKRMMTGTSIVFSRLDDLPAEAAIDKETIKRSGLKSAATMPLIAGGKTIGALAFGSMRTERTWPPAVLERVRSVANMVAGVLARRDTDRQLRDGPASEFYYDGKTMSAFAPAENLVVVSDAPPTIDGTVEAAYHAAAIYFPFTDVLVADPGSRSIEAPDRRMRDCARARRDWLRADGDLAVLHPGLRGDA